MKKVFMILAVAASLTACNNAADNAGEKKDSIENAAEQTKDAIDSSASATKDMVDSTAEVKKDMVDSMSKHADSTHNK